MNNDINLLLKFLDSASNDLKQAHNLLKLERKLELQRKRSEKLTQERSVLPVFKK